MVDLNVTVNQDKLAEFGAALRREAAEEARSGQNKANAQAWREAEAARRRREEEQAKTRVLWAEHYEHMYYAHSALAADYAARAVALQEGEEPNKR